MQYLVNAGVVDVRPGDGTYVRSRTAFDATLQKRLAKEELSTIMETRLLIEPPLTGLAAARRSAEELAQLLQLQQALENSFQTQQADYIARDTAFHLYLAQLCHNPLLRDIYSNIITWHTRLVEQAFLTFCDGDLDLYLHRTLCRYIREQREEEARALTEHMLRAEICQLNG